MYEGAACAIEKKRDNKLRFGKEQSRKVYTLSGAQQICTPRGNKKENTAAAVEREKTKVDSRY